MRLDEPGGVQELEVIEFELTCIFEGNSSLLGVGKKGYYTWVCGVPELLLTPYYRFGILIWNTVPVGDSDTSVLLVPG